MKKIHLDTDLGGDPDDLCALAMLLKWAGVEITGITTVCDDNGKRAGYVRYVLQITGRKDIQLKAGADVSGGFYRYKPQYPKEEKFWPEPISPFPNPVDEALKLLKQSIKKGAVIIGIGQYTNLFLLEKKFPGILKKANIFLMGGYIYPMPNGYPQWTNKDDYNIQLDIRSAKYVYENASPTMVPLSASVKTAIRRAYLPKIKKQGKLGELIAKQAEAENVVSQNEEKCGEVYDKIPNDILNFQHDSLTCAVALGWNGVTMKNELLSFEVKDGLLWEKINKKGKKITVVKEVDGEKFNQLWLKTITGA